MYHQKIADRLAALAVGVGVGSARLFATHPLDLWLIQGWWVRIMAAAVIGASLLATVRPLWKWAQACCGGGGTVYFALRGIDLLHEHYTTDQRLLYAALLHGVVATLVWLYFMRSLFRLGALQAMAVELRVGGRPDA